MLQGLDEQFSTTTVRSAESDEMSSACSEVDEIYADEERRHTLLRNHNMLDKCTFDDFEPIRTIGAG